MVATLGLATLLFACFSNTPAAAPSDQELKNDAVKSYVQTDTAVELEINDALLDSSIGLRTQSVTDNIDALLAKLIVVLPGGVSNQPLQPVTVTTLCAGRYALNNPNTDNLVLTWKSSDGAQRGSFVAAASSVTAFEAQGQTINLFAKSAQIASITSADYTCTEALPDVPGAMLLQVYKVRNKIRVELPASLLPGQRFTLFFNLYPPFAISLVRIQTPAEANKQVALQNAWGLVKEDPRVKDLGLNLDTANLQGEQRNGATLVLIPEKDLGYIQLITRGQEVLLLERWVFFSDTTFTMWNMLNGRRVDFAEAATYAGMKTDLTKRNLFKNLYATAYAQPEGTVIRTGAVQRLTSGCDGCEDLYNKLLNSVSEEINARGDLGTDITDIIIDCVVGAASELSIKGCLNRDALFGIVRSFGNFESFISWLRATTDVDDLKRKLVDCTALKVTDKLCFGNIQLSPVDNKVDGIVGIPNEISYSVFNRAKYSRYINIYTPTSNIPIQTIYTRGSNDYNLFAGYTCLIPGSFQKQIIARTVVDKPNQTQYSDQRDFTLNCASLPAIDLRTSVNQIDSGGLKGLTGRFQPNGSFKGQGIVSQGFSWDFINAYVGTPCPGIAAKRGSLASATGSVIGSWSSNVSSNFDLLNSYQAPIANPCDMNVAISVISKWNPNIRGSETLKVKRVLVTAPVLPAEIFYKQRFYLPAATVQYDATNSGYEWGNGGFEGKVFVALPKENGRFYYDVPASDTVNAQKSFTVRSIADKSEFDVAYTKVVAGVRLAIVNAPYNGPQQICQRVTAKLVFEGARTTDVEKVANEKLYRVAIDGVPAQVFSSVASGNFVTISLTRSCNLAQGPRLISISQIQIDGRLLEPQQTTFVVEDNRWPGTYKNSVLGCVTAGGSTLLPKVITFIKTNPSQTATLQPGQFVPQTRYGNIPTNYNVTSSDLDFDLDITWTFATPFDGNPKSYGYFQNVAHWISCGIPPDHDPMGTGVGFGGTLNVPVRPQSQPPRDPLLKGGS